MKWWAHELCALLVTLPLARGPLDAPLILAGAVFPDVLEWVVGARHRALHELAIYLALLAASLAGGAAVFFLAAVDHLLTDALTVRGITVFGRRVGWVLSTNSVAHNLLAVALHAAVAALLV